MSKNKILLSVSLCVGEDTESKDIAEEFFKTFNDSDKILDYNSFVLQSHETNLRKEGDGSYFEDGILYDKHSNKITANKLKWELS